MSIRHDGLRIMAECEATIHDAPALREVADFSGGTFTESARLFVEAGWRIIELRAFGISIVLCASCAKRAREGAITLHGPISTVHEVSHG